MPQYGFRISYEPEISDRSSTWAPSRLRVSLFPTQIRSKYRARSQSVTARLYADCSER